MRKRKYGSVWWCALLFLGLQFASIDGAVAAEERQPTDAPYRIMHFVLRHVSPEDALVLAEKVKAAGFNTIAVQITDGVKLDKIPWQPLSDAWTTTQFSDWVRDVRALGLDIVPELKLLSHQEKLFQDRHAGLMFNKATYDPRRKEVYEYALPLMDEIISIVQPRAFHIGHDEVVGRNPRSKKKWLKPGEVMLPSDLFLMDVLKIHGFLKTKGIETWMWGDMLISPEEFPDMLAKHLHGTASGYGKPLRDQLPREIVITDWHYFGSLNDFPSLYVMQQEGFRVIGSTWKSEQATRNFSSYASNHGAYGMMATTWFHVQRKEWDLVNKIIKASGETFSKDFPDAKH